MDSNDSRGTLRLCFVSITLFPLHISSNCKVLYHTILIGYVEDISLPSCVSSFRQVDASVVSASEHVKLFDPEWQEEERVANSLHEKLVVVSGLRGWVYGSHCSLSMLALRLLLSFTLERGHMVVRHQSTFISLEYWPTRIWQQLTCCCCFWSRSRWSEKNLPRGTSLLQAHIFSQVKKWENILSTRSKHVQQSFYTLLLLPFKIRVVKGCAHIFWLHVVRCFKIYSKMCTCTKWRHVATSCSNVLVFIDI